VRKQILKGYLLVIGAALIWSLTGLIIRSAVASTLWGTTIRSLTAAVVLFPVMRKYKVKIDKNVILTGIIYVIFVGAFIVTTKIGTSAMAVSMQSAAPLYIIIFEFIKKRKIIKSKLPTFIFIGTGVSLSIIDALKSANAASILFGFIIGAGFLAYSAILRKINTHSALGLIGAINIVAFFCNLAILPFDFYPIPSSAGTIIAFVFAGIFISALSYAMYGTSIRLIGVETAMIIALIEPVLNPVWVYLGTGVAPSVMAIIGLALILGGVIVNTFSEGKSETGEADDLQLEK